MRAISSRSRSTFAATYGSEALASSSVQWWWCWCTASSGTRSAATMRRFGAQRQRKDLGDGPGVAGVQERVEVGLADAGAVGGQLAGQLEAGDGPLDRAEDADRRGPGRLCRQAREREGQRRV